MNATEVVKSFLDAVEARNIDAAAEILAEDFVFSGAVPEPVNKDRFVGLTRINAVAFPDWKFNTSTMEENGNVVEVTVAISGTHSGEWNLSPIGMDVIPSTNKSFSLPPETGTWVVEDGKIKSFTGKPSPTSGVPGILSQLGFEMPNRE